MGTITLNDVSPGAEILSTDVNANNTLIEAVINGGIDDANFAASSPVVVASSIAGLGAVRAGKMGLLRAGSNPFSVVPLIYDATLGKWVSEIVIVVHQHEQGNPTSTSYAKAGVSNFARVTIPNFKALYDAGLRPQVATAAKLRNSGGGNTSFFRVAIYDFNAGDADESTSVKLTGGEISHVGSTGTYKAANWATMTVDNVPGQTHGLVIAQWKVSAGTADVDHASASLRWVSA